MALTSDIAATYRGPGTVMRRLLASRPSEGRVLMLLMAGCLVTFVGQWPRLAREAYLADRALDPLIGGALLAWLFIAPLGFYALALVSHLVLRALGVRADGLATRLALFWAFLAANPLLLLCGLVAGFIGPGAELNLVGAVWGAVFLWFWLSNLRAAGRAAP